MINCTEIILEAYMRYSSKLPNSNINTNITGNLRTLLLGDAHCVKLKLLLLLLISLNRYI